MSDFCVIVFGWALRFLLVGHSVSMKQRTGSPSVSVTRSHAVVVSERRRTEPLEIL
jgi:hypothetical protein